MSTQAAPTKRSTRPRSAATRKRTTPAAATRVSVGFALHIFLFSRVFFPTEAARGSVETYRPWKTSISFEVLRIWRAGRAIDPPQPAPCPRLQRRDLRDDRRAAELGCIDRCVRFRGSWIAVTHHCAVPPQPRFALWPLARTRCRLDSTTCISVHRGRFEIAIRPFPFPFRISLFILALTGVLVNVGGQGYGRACTTPLSSRPTQTRATPSAT